MPYISQEARKRLFTPGETPENAGELNFIVSMIIDQYWHENGKNYQAFNDIMGVLTGAQLEYYRRKIAYYEMAKLMENGDVYRAEKITQEEPGGEGLDRPEVRAEDSPAKTA